MWSIQTYHRWPPAFQEALPATVEVWSSIAAPFAAARARFSSVRMTEGYVAVYRSLLERPSISERGITQAACHYLAWGVA
jgi:hypothetical protein